MNLLNSFSLKPIPLSKISIDRNSEVLSVNSFAYIDIMILPLPNFSSSLFLIFIDSNAFVKASKTGDKLVGDFFISFKIPTNERSLAII